mmetsp:Transcript_18293/g.43748  ORF Transcript_18293/g.43748 Transcript_18293/m.43748 type:complete len:207 (+) Transcript_18293:306-926(+)
MRFRGLLPATLQTSLALFSHRMSHKDNQAQSFRPICHRHSRLVSNSVTPAQCSRDTSNIPTTTLSIRRATTTVLGISTTSNTQAISRSRPKPLPGSPSSSSTSHRNPPAQPLPPPRSNRRPPARPHGSSRSSIRSSRRRCSSSSSRRCHTPRPWQGRTALSRSRRACRSRRASPRRPNRRPGRRRPRARPRPGPPRATQAWSSARR